jgi:hypothetical protein
LRFSRDQLFGLQTAKDLGRSVWVEASKAGNLDLADKACAAFCLFVQPAYCCKYNKLWVSKLERF